MSISRKNWSALSSLARMWSTEDEEEFEREKRRKTREPSTSMEPDDQSRNALGRVNESQESSNQEESEGGGLAQLQMDFVEMLRVRDERRRMRHVETLRRQKEAEEELEGGVGNRSAEPRVERLGNLEKGQQQRKETKQVAEPKPKEEPKQKGELKQKEVPKQKEEPVAASEGESQKESSSTESDRESVSSSSSQARRKFVSSVSMSFDKSPTSPTAHSRLTSPLSPRSPVFHDSAYDPPQRSFKRVQSPTQNGESQNIENGSVGGEEAAGRAPFLRQSSRTASFRMLRKKEEETAPFQRSASVRLTSKKFEADKDSNQEEEQQSAFQRNSRQRISSRSIKEKMEKLAQASQKWEMAKSPASLQRTLCLVDEVSRKREIFEKEQTASEGSPGSPKLDYHSFSAGISERLNRFVQKKGMPGTSSLMPVDLRHVDISSKRSLFEKGNAEEDPHSPHK
ncbi:ladinin-1 [Chanos chanos]|uniref:Ladinin-1 n=1 Tax=Chanos chanos TaxID=29144 RepID=A0A6J2V1L2_CHACN|nr:ladinin-1 [Chanos chanos]